VNAGGFAFACDPELAAPDAPVLWRPELSPLSVVLVPAPDAVNIPRRHDADNPHPIFDQPGWDGNHVVLIEGESTHRLWPRDVGLGAPVAALVPLDDKIALRIAGLQRFHRRLTGLPPGPLPQTWAITARLRIRLLLMLRALDAHLARASYREIAHALYGPDMVARYPWKTSSIRGQTIRLVKDAVATMEGGYRKLLRGNR
jgi:hypothetical protein